MEHMGYEKPIKKEMSWFGVQFGSLEMLWQMNIHEINWTIFIKLVKPREIHTLRESFTTPNYDDNEDDDEEDVPLPHYPLVNVDDMTAIDFIDLSNSSLLVSTFLGSERCVQRLLWPWGSV